jgi:hypothetical protein
MFKRTLKNGFNVMHVKWASSVDTDIVNVVVGEGEKMSLLLHVTAGMLTLYMITWVVEFLW